MVIIYYTIVCDISASLITHSPPSFIEPTCVVPLTESEMCDKLEIYVTDLRKYQMSPQNATAQQRA